MKQLSNNINYIEKRIVNIKIKDFNLINKVTNLCKKCKRNKPCLSCLNKIDGIPIKTNTFKNKKKYLKYLLYKSNYYL